MKFVYSYTFFKLIMRKKKAKETKTSLEKEVINTPANESFVPSLWSGVFQGFSLGTGSAFAQNIFRTDPSKKDCNQLFQEYEKLCSIETQNTDMFDKKQCQTLYENFKSTCLA